MPIWILYGGYIMFDLESCLVCPPPLVNNGKFGQITGEGETNFLSTSLTASTSDCSQLKNTKRRRRPDFDETFFTLY